jgi:hypothetical protein
MPSKYTHGVWCDNNGRWYAKVSTVNVSDRTARERARRAIVRELTEREATPTNPRPRFRLRLKVYTRDLYSVTYRER